MEDISVALSNSKVTYLLSSNSAGNVGLYVFPDNPTQDGLGTVMSESFLSILNADDFNPTLGTQAEQPTLVQGPLFEG
jgi:hypothetical protein